jgi:hypothetical protein
MYSCSRFITFALLLVCAGHTVCQVRDPAAPKPSFAMSISLKDGTVKRGSEISVAVDLTNTSGTEIQLWRARSGPPPYKVQVFDHTGKAAVLTPTGNAFRKGEASVQEKGKVVRVFPGTGSFVRIAPGETTKDLVPIENQFDLSEPGTYNVQLERVDPVTKLLVKSKVVTLIVAN